jgi:hypothetical protein
VHLGKVRCVVGACGVVGARDNTLIWGTLGPCSDLSTHAPQIGETLNAAIHVTVRLITLGMVDKRWISGVSMRSHDLLH